MKKILIPIDGTERSRKAIELVKDLYPPDVVDITILMVREDLDAMRSEADYSEAKKEMEPVLSEISDTLAGYRVAKRAMLGRAGEAILNISQTESIDIIAMTKSTRKGWYQMIGSVATHVVKYAKCIVMIVPE